MSQSQARSDWMDEVVDKYADMVYRIAFTHMKNKADADDIFQEVFLKLCKSAVVFETDEHIKAWLIKVTVNTCRKSFSSSWNKKVVELPEDLAYEDEQQDFEVVPAVQSLPSKYRTVIHLFYFEDMQVAEIAKVLKSTAGIEIHVNVVFNDGSYDEQVLEIDLSGRSWVVSSEPATPEQDELLRQSREIRNIPLEELELIPESVQVVTDVFEYDLGNGLVSIGFLEGAEYPFDENGILRKAGGILDDGRVYLVVIKRDGNDVWTGMVYVAPQ